MSTGAGAGNRRMNRYCPTLKKLIVSEKETGKQMENDKAM